MTKNGNKKMKTTTQKRRKVVEVLRDMTNAGADDEDVDLGAKLLAYDGLMLPSNDEIEQNTLDNRSLQCSTGLSCESYGEVTQSKENLTSISTSPVYLTQDVSEGDTYGQSPTLPSNYTPYPTTLGAAMSISSSLSMYPQTNFVGSIPSSIVQQSSYEQEYSGNSSSYTTLSNTQWSSARDNAHMPGYRDV